MRFVYTQGKYREFRGYVFMYGQPTSVTDHATIEALLQREDFKPVVEEQKRDEPKTETAAAPDGTCPKCGRYIRQGRYMHIKFCRGKE